MIFDDALDKDLLAEYLRDLLRAVLNPLNDNNCVSINPSTLTGHADPELYLDIALLSPDQLQDDEVRRFTLRIWESEC